MNKGEKENKDLFKTNPKEKTFGEIKNSEFLDLQSNKKRVKGIQSYMENLCDIIDGTSNDYMDYVKDLYKLLEIIESELEDNNNLIKYHDLTQIGLGGTMNLITLVDRIID